MVVKDGSLICHRLLNHMREIDPENKLLDTVMFYGASNVHLGGKLLKARYIKLTVLCGVEHTVSLLFKDVSEITIVHKIILPTS